MFVFLPACCAGGEDGVVRVFDLRDGSLAASLSAAQDTVNGVAFHPVLPMLATASGAPPPPMMLRSVCMPAAGAERTPTLSACVPLCAGQRRLDVEPVGGGSSSSEDSGASSSEGEEQEPQPQQQRQREGGSGEGVGSGGVAARPAQRSQWRLRPDENALRLWWVAAEEVEVDLEVPMAVDEPAEAAAAATAAAAEAPVGI